MKHLALTLFLLTGACASLPPEAKELGVHRAPELPARTWLEVPFIAQEPYLCGPTVLKMAAPKELATPPLEKFVTITYTAKAHGTYKADMLSAARRLEMTPYRVQNVKQMMQALATKRPVVVFENLGLSWWPRWHYALLVGYNADTNSVTLHTGSDAYSEENFAVFHRAWDLGGRWSYILTTPNSIPAFATFEEAFENAAVFENLRQPEKALALYRSMRERWPQRFEADLGIAVLLYEKKDLRGSLKHLQEARRKNPKSPVVQHNLALLQRELTGS